MESREIHMDKFDYIIIKRQCDGMEATTSDINKCPLCLELIGGSLAIETHIIKSHTGEELLNYLFKK